MKNIHVLPTDKPSRLRYNLSNILVLTKEPYRDYSKQVNQNIYITSDEEIKEGDWFVMNGCIIRQCKLTNKEPHTIHTVVDTTGGIHHVSVCKKIIATTDKSLTINITRILGVTRELPQISQSFIEYFVSKYNKGNIITKVMVEYEVRNDFKDMEDALNGDAYKLKINSDNTINIKSIKDSWNKYEFIANLIKYREDYETFKQSCHFGPNPKEIEEWSNKWIEKNL